MEQTSMAMSFHRNTSFTPLSVNHTSTERVRDQQDVFLATKLRLPRPRSSSINRPVLIARLQSGREGKLTLLSAPAGAGKTTLLAHWLKGTDLPSAWLSLEAEENEPMRFFSYLIAALQTLDPELGTATQPLLQSPPFFSAEHILTLLSNEISASNLAPFVLVLDDYHLIQSEIIHAAMAFLLEHLPHQMHLIIATRIDPPFPLTRLRASGELTELRTADFRLNRDEIQALLQMGTSLDLDAEAVATIESRTEGWIAGVQLAALSLRHTSDPYTFLQTFHGDHRFILDYLTEEVFLQQSVPVQEFLLSTCILARLQGTLCNAVTGLDNGQMMLETLEKENLFLVSLDATRQWYRYHWLFAEVLRIRLCQSQPEREATLHDRASQWYEHQGFVVEAIEHAVQANTVDRVVALLQEYGFACILEREIPGLMLEWLQALPASLVEADSHLCLLQAMSFIYLNRNERVLPWLQRAQAGLQTDKPGSQHELLRARLAACNALVQFAFGEITHNALYVQEALDLLPENEMILRSHVMQCALRGYRANGDVSSTTERLVVSAVASARLPNTRTMLLLSMDTLAWIQILRGRLHQAAATYREITKIVSPEQEHRSLQLGGPSYSIGFGFLLREWNQLDLAEKHLSDGLTQIKSVPLMSGELLTVGYVTMANLYRARGEYDRALSALDELNQLIAPYPFSPWLTLMSTATRVEIELARGNLQIAIQWAERDAPSLDEPPNYLYERGYLACIRVRLAQSRAYPKRVALPELIEILERLQTSAETKARTRSVLEIRILRALALDLLGRQQEAVGTLGEVLRHTEPEQMVRLLADEGLPMRQLLSNIHTTHPRKQEYLQQVIAACTPDLDGGEWETATPVPPLSLSRSQQQQVLPDPLSERELEVLHLMSEGASNNDIAEQLVIAVSTVKRHVTNIFSKLGVSNRTQAVAKARQYGLL
jgi:LuxR family maltose regulon positive regulatory protein